MKPFVFSAWRDKWLGKWGRPRSFLRKITGLIHVGANIGQERELYAEYDLNVVWIEPIPNAFEQLCENLKPFPKQRAYRYLITENCTAQVLHIASNTGASSSILQLEKHRAMWPDISYTGELQMAGITLSGFVEKERLRLADYQALVLDTQGSELMILRGAGSLLDGFRFIQVEVADFESYLGCCQLREMEKFMQEHVFRERSRKRFRFLRGVGSYYDVVYEHH